MQVIKKMLILFLTGILSILNFSCSKIQEVGKPKCLAIGSAKSVLITEVKEKPGCYKVIVKGSNPSTVLFTHRPKRNSKVVDTEEFINRWSSSYKSSAPNVTFTSVTSSRTTSNILVLSNPVCNERKNIITFDAEALDDKDAVQPGLFTNVTICYDTQVQNLSAYEMDETE